MSKFLFRFPLFCIQRLQKIGKLNQVTVYLFTIISILSPDLGSYTLEFHGVIEGESKAYLVSTSYYLSASATKLVDACANNSQILWNFLGSTLNKIKLEETNTHLLAIFIFNNDESFVIWQEMNAMDNLLLVTDQHTKEWFPVF